MNLKYIYEWFKANKLSLNIFKTKYYFFHPKEKSDTLLLRLPKVIIDNTIIKRTQVTKFLGVLIDEYLTWKDHINTINNKIAKNIGILYKARPLLNSK